jgi:hypothetical protein
MLRVTVKFCLISIPATFFGRIMARLASVSMDVILMEAHPAATPD